MYSFSFPKTSPRQPRGVKSLTTAESFPASSTNVRSTGFTTFVDGAPPKNTFRSRNSFVIARGALSCMMREKKSNFTSVSKSAASLWAAAGRPFKSYFEYLSLLESIWHDRKQSMFAPAPTANLSYTELFQPSKRAATGGGTRLKFRLNPAKKVQKKRAAPSFQVKGALNCRWGIVTEDIFR
ncbi:uncharacterized protein LODBEIA_P56870 [Lodderomyces beijingensis]|uniref:Uncharacterized protein n=1 Tax=Lodderomyces beijingensis TaxID=1775926 RepID=A0ABP0ZMP2_9ASCO